MVDGVSFSGTNLGQYRNDIGRIASYVYGTQIVAPKEKIFDVEGLGGVFLFGIPGVMGAGQLLQFFWSNRNDMKQAWARQGAIFNNEMSDVGHRLTHLGSPNTYKTFLDDFRIKKVQEMLPNEEKLFKLSEIGVINSNKAAGEAVNAYGKAMQKMKFANPKEVNTAIKEAKQLIAEGDALSHGLLPRTGITAPIRNFFGKCTGNIFSKISGAAKNLAAKSPAVAGGLRFLKKSGGIFALISVAMELPNIISAFGLGADKGIVQTGKSGLKIVGSLGGWLAGEAAAMAIGSFFGPLGTVFGGVAGIFLGIFGGTLGSWVADKGVKMLVGKDEPEIALEKKAEQLATEATQDPAKLQELMAAAQQKIDQEGQNSEDAKVAFGSLTKLAQVVQPAANNSQYLAQADPTSQGSGGANSFATNAYSDYMNKDFMAMGAGLEAA